VAIAAFSMFFVSAEPSLASCASIKDNTDRLSCYDSLYKATKPENSMVHKIIPAQSKLAVVPENFGLKEKLNSSAPQGVSAVIKSTSALNNGRVSINLDNGQTWRSNNDPGRLRLKPLTKVTITESRIGGFVLKAEGQKGFVRVKRVK
jgi:hypothetical protein